MDKVVTSEEGKIAQYSKGVTSVIYSLKVELKFPTGSLKSVCGVLIACPPDNIPDGHISTDPELISNRLIAGGKSINHE